MSIDINAPLGPCPWGREHVDLSAVELDETEKLWLAKFVIEKQDCVSGVARKYKLKRRNLQDWVGMVRKGVIPRSSVGRPEVLSHGNKKELRKMCSQKTF